VLGDVIVNRGIIYVVPPGTTVGNNTFKIPMTDIVNVKQDVDYSLDFPAVLNPFLLLPQFDPEGMYIYDDEHARKQANTKLTIGAPVGTGAKDFVEIPDGWMVEGTFEEWTPPAGTDFSNPATTANNGRYWKIFRSPADPNMLRGILNFTRIVKDLKLNGVTNNPLKTNLTPFNSLFVGTPITASSNPTLDQPSGAGPNFLQIDNDGNQDGIYGFTADIDQVQDIISDQTVDVQNSFSAYPPSRSAGDASSNYYTLQYGLWIFPKIKPTIRGAGDPTNPFGIPPGTIIVNPSQNVLNFGGAGNASYYQDYLRQYKQINSPRLKTSVSCVFRGVIPQPGDALIVNGIDKPTCGRISSVSLSMSRGGTTMTIQAELYNYGPPSSQQFGNAI